MKQTALVAAQLKAEELLSQLLEQIILLEGKRGRGKTLAAVALAYQLRELFGRRVVVVGSKAGLRSEFGDYQFLDEGEFLRNLEGIAEVSKSVDGDVLREAVEETLTRMGINILESTMIFDEAYKLFDSRTPSEKLVRVFGYFIAQSRHYKTTIILTSPHRDMLDKRVRRQIDWFGRCYFSPKTMYGIVRFVSTSADTLKLRVYGPNYFDMFDSWVVLGYRKKHLKMKEV